MSDARDTNHDGKVSLMEKVKDKLHGHKNTDTTTASSTHHTTSTAHHTTAAGAMPTTANTAGAVPIIGQVPVAVMPIAGAVPLAGAPLTTGAGYDSRDLNRDGHVSGSEQLRTAAIGTHNTGAHDSRDLNRDGHVSTGERLAAGSHTQNSGAYDSRDLNRDGHLSTGERLAAGSHANMSEEARLRLHEEQLAISKREVGAGEVDIHKRVHETHVQQTVPVRREEVIVERRPLSGAVDANYQISSQDETMRVPLFREEIVTEKRIVPTEEVIVRKKEVIDQQTVGATLRSEHVETVQTGTHSSATMGGAYDARDTNRDGHVSMGEKLTNSSGTHSTTGFADSRDKNHDGHVSMGEKLQGGQHTSGMADSRDKNHDGRVSAGEKLQSAARG